LPAINDYSGFFAGKMPAFPVEVIEEYQLKRGSKRSLYSLKEM